VVEERLAQTWQRELESPKITTFDGDEDFDETVASGPEMDPVTCAPPVLSNRRFPQRGWERIERPGRDKARDGGCELLRESFGCETTECGKERENAPVQSVGVLEGCLK